MIQLNNEQRLGTEHLEDRRWQVNILKDVQHVRELQIKTAMDASTYPSENG